MFRRVKQLLVGSPLETAALPEQRLGKPGALAVLASDNMSIAAYASEEIVLALVAAAAVGTLLPLHYVVPLSVAAVVLIAIVVVSYGQTMYAYPSGGGAYTVAKENLGVTAALAGAAALLLDYILTVAVSVAAGIAAITSAVPELFPYRVLLCILAVTVLLLVNLRGARESAAVFAGPVYFFILSMFVLILGGLVRYLQGAVVPPPAAAVEAEVVWNAGYVFFLLRAFSHGCVALTGVEAVANGVRLFRPPVSRNAAITLYIMGGLTAAMFLGISFLASVYAFLPRADETLISQIGRAIFGTGAVYYAIQVATMAILILAANTPFADFPRLASIVAQDRFLPRQLANLGDRLVFSNGIIFLAAFAMALLVLYGGDVHSLIPLYMVGVFLAFTLSQAGMVVHWHRSHEPGKRWRMALNAIGATATGLVLIIVAVVKFTEGAWMVVFALGAVILFFRKVRNHYYEVQREVSLADYEKPEQRRHLAVVPVAGINRIVLPAIEYARSIAPDVVAVTVNIDNQDRERLVERWSQWVPDVPLVVLESPYRSIHRPLIRLIKEISNWRGGEDLVTVVIPEYVPARWWHFFLHNQTSLILKASLLFAPRVIVTSIPHQLRRS